MSCMNIVSHAMETKLSTYESQSSSPSQYFETDLTVRTGFGAAPGAINKKPSSVCKEIQIRDEIKVRASATLIAIRNHQNGSLPLLKSFPQFALPLMTTPDHVNVVEQHRS